VRSQRGNEEVVWSKSIKFNHKESGTELSSVMTFATDIAKYTQYCDKSAQAKSGRCAALDVAAFDFEQSDKCGNCAPGTDCFTTVNAVINSAITKLAKVTPLAPDRTLYRGVAGMGFSPELLELEHGPRGFVEFAFSSATPNEDIARQYAAPCHCVERAQRAEAAAAEAGGLDTLQGLQAALKLNCAVVLTSPKLKSALDALHAISPQDVEELRFISQPLFELTPSNPSWVPVKTVMQALCISKAASPEPAPGWAQVKALLDDPAFPHAALGQVDPGLMSEATLAALTRLCDECRFTSEGLKSISKPAALLWTWLSAAQAFASVARKIKNAGELGFKWEAIGESRPLHGRLLADLKLGVALASKAKHAREATFTAKEWSQIGVKHHDLCFDDFVKADTLYYRPAGGGLNSEEGLRIAVEAGLKCQVYSAWNESKGYCELHRSTLLEIKTGQVDRGATLKWISQFPADNEHVLLPMSNFEIKGMRREKHLNILQLHLNTSLKAMTMEQLRESRKRAVLDLGVVLLRESGQLLAGSEGSSSLRQLEARLLGPIRQADADSFDDTASFRARVNGLFEAWGRLMDAEVLQLKNFAQDLYAQGMRTEAQLEAVTRATTQAIRILERTSGSGGARSSWPLSLFHVPHSIDLHSPSALETVSSDRQEVIHLHNLRNSVAAKSMQINQAVVDARVSSSEVAAALVVAGDTFASSSSDSGARDKALTCYEGAIKIMSSQFKNISTLELANLFNKKALLQTQQGEHVYADALRSFEQGLRLAEACAVAGTELDQYSLLLSAQIMENMGVFLYAYKRTPREREREIGHVERGVRPERIGKILRFRRSAGDSTWNSNDAVQLLEWSLETKVRVVGGGAASHKTTLAHIRYAAAMMPDVDSMLPRRIFSILAEDVDAGSSVIAITDHMHSTCSASSSAPLLEWGVSALCSLAAEHKRTQPLNAGLHSAEVKMLIVFVVDAMRKHFDHSGVCSEGCRALLVVLEVPTECALASSVWTCHFAFSLCTRSDHAEVKNTHAHIKALRQVHARTRGRARTHTR